MFSLIELYVFHLLVFSLDVILTFFSSHYAVPLHCPSPIDSVIPCKCLLNNCTCMWPDVWDTFRHHLTVHTISGWGKQSSKLSVEPLEFGNSKRKKNEIRKTKRKKDEGCHLAWCVIGLTLVGWKCWYNFLYMYILFVAVFILFMHFVLNVIRTVLIAIHVHVWWKSLQIFTNPLWYVKRNTKSV